MADVKMYSDEFDYQLPNGKYSRGSITLDVDLGKYTTKAGACKALHKALVAFAESYGWQGSGVMLVRPEDNELVAHDYIAGWGICWEDGPYEWAIGIDGASGPWGYDEPGYSFSLAFAD